MDTHDTKSGGENDINSIEQQIESLRKSSIEGDGFHQGFFKVFEEYKASVSREMMKMRKNLTIVRQENDALKGSSLELKKREDQLEKLKTRLQDIDDEQSIVQSSMKLKSSKIIVTAEDEELSKLSLENKILKAEKMNFSYLLQETVKKLKKKSHNIENALSLLNEADQTEIEEMFKDLGVKL